MSLNKPIGASELPEKVQIIVGDTLRKVIFEKRNGALRSSSRDYKGIELESGKEVDEGVPYDVVILSDTNPDDPNKGKLIGRVIGQTSEVSEEKWKEVEERVTGVEKASRKATKRAAEIGALSELTTGKPMTLAERLGMSTEEAIEDFKKRVQEHEARQGSARERAERISESSAESKRTQAAIKEERAAIQEVESVLGPDSVPTLEQALVSFRLMELKEALRQDADLDEEKERLAHPPKLSLSREADAEHKLRSIKRKLKGIGVTSAAAEATADIEPKLEAIEEKREALMQESPEAFIGLHLKDLKKYRREFESGKIVETPYVEKQALEMEACVHRGQPVFIYGHLGSGKTELALHVAFKVLEERDDLVEKDVKGRIVKDKRHALVISGSKYMSQSEMYGHQVLKASEEGSTVSDFYLGPVYQAMEDGRPLVIDEVNAIPHEVLISLNHVLTRRPGDVINVQQDSGKQIIVKDGFSVIMTGNLNVGAGESAQKYVSRERMDPAFISRLKLMEHDYLPQNTDLPFKDASGVTTPSIEGVKNELYSVLVASMMDRQGNMEAPAEALEQLWQLASVARKTQEAFSGKRKAEYAQAGGRSVQVPIQYAVISMRGLKNVIDTWQADAYQKPLEREIFDVLIKDQPLPQERAWLYQLFQNEGFFKDSDGWVNSSSLQNVQNSFDVKPPKAGRGKTELEFHTPRELVQLLYGDIPERKRFPVYRGGEKEEADTGFDAEKAEKLAEYQAFAEKVAEEIKGLESMVAAHCELEQKAASAA